MISINSGLLTVNLDALVANYQAICDLAPSSRCAAVVKANAYGLGVETIAPVLLKAGCQDFFVATGNEAIQLRALLPTASIYVFDGGVPDTEMELLRHRVTPVLSTPDQVERWLDVANHERPGKKIAVLIQIDTGMTRLGFSEHELRYLTARSDLMERLKIDYVMTHLASADTPDIEFTTGQIRRFDELRRLLPPAPTSIGNSGGILLGSEFQGDLVRPGIALYGGNPSPGTENRMQEVVHLQGRILQIKEIDQMVRVGYGGTHIACPPARLAVVGIGYADGYLRSLGNRGFGCIGDNQTPVVGRISMDMLTVDVSNVPNGQVYEGALVDLIGGGVALDTTADLAGTISYEILTRLSSRLQIRYKRT